MSKELNCMNCSIGDFKYELCDCNNGFCKEFKSIGTQEDFFNAVIQRIRPQGDWIPVSERLPEVNKAYSDCEGFDNNMQPFGVYTCYASETVLAYGQCNSFRDYPIKDVFTAKYERYEYDDGKIEECWRDNTTGDIDELDILAWMPLPEPYKGGDSE